jgi:membrane protease YdiL (CAAX protease family)
MMRAFAIGAGEIVLVAAWWSVSSRRRDLWHVIPVVLAVMGVIAFVLAPGARPGVPEPWALVVGAVSGVALFVATRTVVALAIHWRPFARHVVDAYREAGEEPFVRSLVLTLLVSVPSEEFFFRGLTQRTLAETSFGAAGAAGLTLVLHVLANLPSRSLPIVAGAIVGGAVWGALAWWSGGIVAPLASHVGWTGLMLVLPPRVDAAKVVS